MTRNLLSLALLVVACSTAIAATTEHPQHLTVRFRHGTVALPPGRSEAPLADARISMPGLRKSLARAGVVRLERIFPSFDGARPSTNRIGERVLLEDLSEIYAVYVSGPITPFVTARLENVRGVVSAAAEEERALALVPNDTSFTYQWWLDHPSTNCAGGTSGVDINGPEAWNITTGTSHPVKVGILDTGISQNHPDLVGRVVLGPNYTSAVVCTCLDCPPPPCSPPSGHSSTDDNDHGTAVAGIVGATGNNVKGGAGVNWGDTLVAIKVANCQTLVRSCWSAQGIDWAWQNGIPIINMSYFSQPGGDTLSGASGPDAAEREAARNAFYSGTLLVAAMGNNGNDDKHYPAAYAKLVCAVGGLDANGNRWYSSNHGSWIDLCAPAEKIVTTQRPSTYYTCASPFSGTSAAAPIVTGVASLLLSKDPSLLGEDLQQVMQRTAADVTSSGTGWDEYTGYGYPRADAALNYIGAPNRLSHFQATSLTVQDSASQSVAITHVPELSDGTYNTVRYRLRKAIAFVPPISPAPVTWVRSSGTIGLASYATYDQDEEVYSGTIDSVTAFGCNVQTYVYRVLDGSGQHLMWLPAPPANAAVAISAVGTPDSIAPAAITTLTPTCATDVTISLKWKAPGDDGSTGTASAYDLRYSTSPITAQNFSSATAVTGLPNPGSPGVWQSKTVDNLPTCTQYYFAIKTRDEVNNWSAISNVASSATLCSYCDCSGHFCDESKTIPMPGAPLSLRIGLPQPNPATESSALVYDIPQSLAGAAVEMSIFDITGRRVRDLFRGIGRPGSFNVVWDLTTDGGARVRPGVFKLRVHVGDREFTRTVLVAR